MIRVGADGGPVGMNGFRHLQTSLGTDRLDQIEVRPKFIGPVDIDSLRGLGYG